MKKFIILLTSIVLVQFSTLYAQFTGDHLNKSLSVGLTSNTVVSAGQSITLLPGFQTSGYNFHAYINGNCVPIASSPSSGQNYIISYTIKESGITNPADPTLTTCQVNASIQYIDGLGRPIQTVSVKGSPTFRDVVQPIVYDVFDREAKKYLPYTATPANSNGSYKPLAIAEQASFYSDPAGTVWNAPGVVQIPQVNGQVPSFAETGFEASPLDRVSEQGAAGDAWQLTNGHTIKTVYSVNNASGDYSVRQYTAEAVSTPGEEHKRTLSSIGNYPANELNLVILKDENWSSSQAFPKSGTVEEYKDKAQKVILKRTFNEKNNALETLSTYYIYDDLGNLSFVLPPGADPDAGNIDQTKLDTWCYQYRYDGRKRQIETKLPGKGWEYKVYNKLDNVVMSQDANQRNHSNQDWLVTKYDENDREVATGIFTHNGSTAQTSYRAAMQDYVNNQSFQWDIRQTGGNGYTNAQAEYRTYPQLLNTTLSLNYYDSYDFPGNSFGTPSTGQSSSVVTLLTGTKVNTLGSSTMLLTVNYYDEDGRVIQKKSENHLGGTDVVTNTYSFTDELLTSTRVHTANSTSTTIATRYEYDHVGRKKKTYQQIGNTPEIVLLNTTYNEVGQLKAKDLHSLSNGRYLHTTNYTYNERGWKRNIAGTKFNLTLAYNTDILTGASPAYNGNIAEARYTTDHTGANQIRYEYDKANRLIRSLHSQSVLTEDQIQYDLMGNIQYLERGVYGNLTYAYTGNQLSSVSGYLNKTYTYDPNGNMKTDGTKAYDYNMLNLPSQVIPQGGGAAILTYVYDAERNKLKSTGSTGTWDYVDGIHYQNNQLKFINTEEGRAVYDPSANSFKYEYALEDHLGNSRVFIDELSGQPRVIQEDEYYSFGLRHGRYDYASNNRYLYNGKELQDEIGMYDYGARFYDPAIGRWHSVDPRVEEDDEWSPYNYVRNNPILYNDPDGELWNVVIGAAIGAAVDYGTQVAGNLVQGKTLSQSLTQVDGKSIAASAVLGGLSSGASALGVGGVKATMVVGARALPKVTTAQKVVAKTATTAKRVMEKAKEKAEPHGNSKSSPKPTEKYTLKDQDGKPYHGVGDPGGTRAKQSIKTLEKANPGKKFTKTYSKIHPDRKSAYKDEHKGIQGSGGPQGKDPNGSNYNKINSPGGNP